MKLFLLGLVLFQCVVSLDVSASDISLGSNKLDVKLTQLQCETVAQLRSSPELGKDNQIGHIDCKTKDYRSSHLLILDETPDMYKIFHDGRVGWIAKSITIKPKIDPTKAGNRFEKIASGSLNCHTRLNIRREPGMNYKIKGKIPCRSKSGKRTKISVLGHDSNSGWYYVNYGNTKGWVSSNFVEVESEDLLNSVKVVREAFKGIKNTGRLGIFCGQGLDDNTSCMIVDHSFFQNKTSAKKIAEEMQAADRHSKQEKKRKFKELFGPIAVHIQTLTGWPASVTLSQMALETNWGTSNVFKRLNNFGGHSCTRMNINARREVRNISLKRYLRTNPHSMGSIIKEKNRVFLKTPCTYPRPKNEGYFYRSFESVLDAAYLYADNVLANSAYKNAQGYIAAAHKKGQRPDPYEVIRGLGAYAADKNYRTKLKNIMKANDFGTYNNVKECGK